MGNSNRKLEDYSVLTTYNPSHWIKYQQLDEHEIWENNKLTIRADAYKLHGKVLNQIEKYEMRKKNQQDIVTVHNLVIQKNDNLCSKAQQSYVLVQRIPYRLKDVHDLSQQQALTTLRSSFKGFNALGAVYGPFEPYEDMICFNQQGVVKVWLNSNLASNEVRKSKEQGSLPFSDSNLNQLYIRKVFDMVQNRTLGRSLPQALKNRFRAANFQTYFEALNGVEQYAQQNGVLIKDQIARRQSALSLNLNQPKSASNPTLNQNHPEIGSSPFNQSTSLLSKNSQTNRTENNLPHSSFNFRSYIQQNSRPNPQMPKTIGFAKRIPRFIAKPQPNIVMPFQYMQNKPPSYVVSASKSISRINTPEITPNIGSPMKRVQNLISYPRIANFSNQFAFAGLRTERFDQPIKITKNQPIQQIYHTKAQTKKIDFTNQKTSNIDKAQIISIEGPDNSLKSSAKITEQDKREQSNQEEVHDQQSQDSKKIIQNHRTSRQNMSPSAQIHQQKLNAVYGNQQIHQHSPSFHPIIIRTDTGFPFYQSLPYPSVPQKPIFPGVKVVFNKQQMQKNRAVQNTWPGIPRGFYHQNMQQQPAFYRYSGHQFVGLSHQNNRVTQVLHHNIVPSYVSIQSGQIESSNYHIKTQPLSEQSKREQQNLVFEQATAQVPDRQQKPSLRQASPKYSDFQEYANIGNQNDKLIDQPQQIQQNLQFEQHQQIKEPTQIQNQQVNISGDNNLIELITSPMKISSQIESLDNRLNVLDVKRIESRQQTKFINKFNNSTQALDGLLEPQYSKIQRIIGEDIYHEQEVGQSRGKRVEPRQFQKSCQNTALQSRIPDDANINDIQAYIRKKYSSYIDAGQDDHGYNYTLQQDRKTYRQNESNRPNQIVVQSYKTEDHQIKIANYLQSKYDQFKSRFEDSKTPYYGSEKQQERVSDLFDVKVMERSLDKKYNSGNQQKNNLVAQQQMNQDDGEFGFDIKKLQANLIRFQESRVGNQSNNNLNKQKYSFSDVSRIGSLDDKDRASSPKISMQKRDLPSQRIYTFVSETSKDKDNFGEKYKKYSNGHKLSSHFDAINQKFEKYVKGNDKNKKQMINSQAKKSSAQQSGHNQQNWYPKNIYYQKSHYTSNKKNDNIYDESRQATGKFNTVQGSAQLKNKTNNGNHRRQKSTVSEVYATDYRSNDKSEHLAYTKEDHKKGITYEELRNLLWS